MKPIFLTTILFSFFAIQLNASDEDISLKGMSKPLAEFLIQEFNARNEALADDEARAAMPAPMSSYITHCELQDFHGQTVTLRARSSFDNAQSEDWIVNIVKDRGLENVADAEVTFEKEIRFARYNNLDAFRIRTETKVFSVKINVFSPTTELGWVLRGDVVMPSNTLESYIMCMEINY